MYCVSCVLLPKADDAKFRCPRPECLRSSHNLSVKPRFLTLPGKQDSRARNRAGDAISTRDGGALLQIKLFEDFSLRNAAQKIRGRSHKRDATIATTNASLKSQLTASCCGFHTAKNPPRSTTRKKRVSGAAVGTAGRVGGSYLHTSRTPHTLTGRTRNLP